MNYFNNLESQYNSLESIIPNSYEEGLEIHKKKLMLKYRMLDVAVTANPTIWRRGFMINFDYDDVNDEQTYIAAALHKFGDAPQEILEDYQFKDEFFNDPNVVRLDYTVETFLVSKRPLGSASPALGSASPALGSSSALGSRPLGSASPALGSISPLSGLRSPLGSASPMGMCSRPLGSASVLGSISPLSGLRSPIGSLPGSASPALGSRPLGSSSALGSRPLGSSSALGSASPMGMCSRPLGSSSALGSRPLGSAGPALGSSSVLGSLNQ